MHNLCESEMKKAASDATELIKHWNIYMRKRGYHKSFLYTCDSYMNNAPLGQKIAKLKMMKTALKEWLECKYRDTMSYEDDLSRVNERYINAQLRRRDYDRYFVLATRYGVMSEEEFHKDSHPGDRYFKQVNKAALMFQKRWELYWPIKRLRMHRAARMFQTHYRGYSAYKKWHPVIILRLRIGRRSYYKFCWKLWLEYNQFIRNIKESIAFYLENWVPKCFSAWKGYTKMKIDRKNDVMNRFVRRMKNQSLAGIYMRWVNYTKRCIHIKLTARRILHNPHFLIWVQYTKMNKHIKYLAKHAIVIQAQIRCYLLSKKYKLMLKNGFILSLFYRICMAKLEKLKLRDICIQKEYHMWLPGELDIREKKSNDKERRRLILQQQYIQERENQAILDIKRHLRRSDGKYQVKDLARKLMSTDRKLKMKDAKVLVTNKLMDDCSSLSRTLSKHDFNTKTPPLYMCADNTCRAIFSTEDQYHNHLLHAAQHGDKSLQFSHFHISLKSVAHQDQMREYLIRMEGVDRGANCLDFWLALQEWKKIGVTSDLYVKQAVVIYETYLRPNCIRPLKIDIPNINIVLEKMEIVKNREFDGVYKMCQAKQSWLRWLVFLEGKKYVGWTNENIVNPEIFNEIEWLCVLYLCNYFTDNNVFMSSLEGQKLHKLIIEEKRTNYNEFLDQYKEIRRSNSLYDAKLYLANEAKLVKKSYEVIDVLLNTELDYIVNELMLEEATKKTFSIRHDEQAIHEAVTNCADDVESWAEDIIIEDVYDHFVNAVISVMWENPDTKKELLEFGGYLRKQVQPRLLFNLNVQTQSKLWFDEFINNAIKEDEESRPLDKETAPRVLQKYVRGMISRNIVRKIFTKVYVKRYCYINIINY
jgi:hypothetical protein